MPSMARQSSMLQPVASIIAFSTFSAAADLSCDIFQHLALWFGVQIRIEGKNTQTHVHNYYLHIFLNNTAGSLAADANDWQTKECVGGETKARGCAVCTRAFRSEQRSASCA